MHLTVHICYHDHRDVNIKSLLCLHDEALGSCVYHDNAESTGTVYCVSFLQEAAAPATHKHVGTGYLLAGVAKSSLYPLFDREKDRQNPWFRQK